MGELSIFDNLEKVAKKEPAKKLGDLKTVKLLKGLLAHRRKGRPDEQLAVNILNLSDSDKAKVREAITKLETDMHNAQSLIDRDKKNLQKLKALL